MNWIEWNHEENKKLGNFSLFFKYNMIQDLLEDIGTGFILRWAFCDYIETAILKGFEIILLYKDQFSLYELH